MHFSVQPLRTFALGNGATARSTAPSTSLERRADEALGAPLFPLPLTPFERYMVVDQRPGYPMTFVMEFLFDGSVDHEVLERSAQHALARHPLFTARLASPRGAAWIEEDAPTRPAVRWVERGAWSCSVGTEIDPCRDPLMQIRACPVDGGFALQLIVHHAAADGLGTYDFMADLLQAYRSLAGDSTHSSSESPCNPLKLPRRGLFEVELPEPVSRWTAWRYFASEATRFLARRVVRIGVPSHENKSSPHALLTMTLPQHLDAPLQRYAIDAGATFNSLLLATVFQAVASLPAVPQRRWIRVAAPVNLRGRQARDMPAANCIGYAFLDRRPAACRRPDDLLHSIEAEMRLVRRWSLAATFVDGIARIDRLPGGLRLATRTASSAATIVCSNLGDVGRRIERRREGRKAPVLLCAAAAPPVRPGTSASLGVVRVGRNLCISLARDRRRLSAAAGEALLRRIALEFAKWVQVELADESLEVVHGLARPID